ncbi:hypothetical protein [Sedimenticola selenatireducens]|uniref:Uncharacterized protein n=1 Tax=Sedimenticola selenatireducens TaxID=191960 RepID=A0A558DNV5_9GAMM|nr:hypothetical protein [Sedimenticola selenatireducens]TVO78450.1 hypothetical protein FHP88_01940 [Sedimenticola selenatireducens]TVT62691.1 MAG: hypothetical protein FHK78_13515 [Sedimenticola selenatireducens]
MRTYIAMTGKQRFSGGWYQCIHWGHEKVSIDRSMVVKVVTIRPGEKHGRIVSEVTADGVRQIAKGRIIPAHKLRHTA